MPLTAEPNSMHSWVFRNRSRLKLIYGAAPEPVPALPAGKPEPVEPQGTLNFDPDADNAPGQVIRRKSYIVLQPMPRRRGA